MSTPNPPQGPYPQRRQREHEPWTSPRPPQPPQPRLPREELAATLAAHRELGPEYEGALVERLAYEVDQVIEAQAAERFKLLDHSRRVARDSLTLAIVSLGAGVPITAISAGIAKLPGLAVAWLGIVGVNAAHAWATRRHR